MGVNIWPETALSMMPHAAEASRQEIIRRYYNAVDGIADGSRSETERLTKSI